MANFPAQSAAARETALANLATAAATAGYTLPIVGEDLDSLVGLTNLVGSLLTHLPAAHNVTVFNNAIRTYIADGKLTTATLVISGADATQFKTTATCVYTINGAVYSKVATDNLTFSAVSTVNNAQAAGTAHWGVFLVQIDSAGTVSTKPGTFTSGSDQDYATEPLAIAVLPAVDANNTALGYITVQAKTGGLKWTANTDDMTPTSDCTDANFYDLPAVKTIPAALA